VTTDAESRRPAGAPPPSTPVASEELLRPSAGHMGVDHANPRGCPFLVAEAGGWRLDTPSRDHQCGAFSPAAPLSPEKQARLCLTPGHTACATYTASLSARTERLGAAPVRRATRWGLARTTSVIEDAGGIRARLLASLLDRRRWPAVPAIILVTTLFVLALSGFRPGLPASPVATSSTGPIAATSGATPTVPARPTATAAPGTGAPESANPTAAPGTPRPAASFRTYRVKSGDTLIAIAGRFGVTVAAIVALNNMSDPGALRIGQVLRIP
jgi:LysM repeat protein